VTHDAPDDQERLNRDQRPQRIVAVRAQSPEEVLLLGGLGDPKKAAGNVTSPSAARPCSYRDMNVV
jgi:hypothetical protein